MMKKYSLPVLLALSMVLTIWACKPERPTLDDASSKLEGINASFVLENVTQLDLRAPLGGELDISEVYAGANPSVITFNSTDFTWTLQENDSPNYLGTSGTWAFDDNEYPTVIKLVQSGLTDTTMLNMDATIRTVDEYLKFTYEKGCGQSPAIAYQYEFKRL